jgi:hypothetical protein
LARFSNPLFASSYRVTVWREESLSKNRRAGAEVFDLASTTNATLSRIEAAIKTALELD